MLDALAALTTPHLADACIRIGAPVRCGPPGLRPVAGHARFAGPAQPVRHTGSVDVILEAIGSMPPGAVLVVDDDARTDRACIGDLIVLEARYAGAAAIVVNGLHRDTDDLVEIGLAVRSLGSSPTGPLEWSPSPPDALTRCQLGEWTVTRDDYLIGDRDGVIIVATAQLDELVRAAAAIRDRERDQAQLAREGTSLREQFGFDEYLAKRASSPTLTFRQHLAARSASIEE
jgi:regulator of RNase E activity RraA